MKIEAALACLQSSGTIPNSIDLLKINVRGEASCSENSDNNPGTIPSGPSRRQQETTTNSTVQNYTAVECHVPHVAILEGKVIFK